MFHLKGRTALVTGSTSGREHGGRAEFIRTELASPESAAALARDAEEALGQVDVLVNNAGLVQFGPTAGTDASAFDASYGLNVKVPFFVTATLAPRMAERGCRRIVNVATVAARFGMAGAALHGSSKAALQLLTQAWAAEFGAHGVTVNAVAPGPTRTLGAAAFGDAVEQLARAAPAGRAALPAEIAAAVPYLASTEAGSSTTRRSPSTAVGPRRDRRSPMDLQLGGERALVTGSSSGLGEAIARARAAEGVEVVVQGRREASVNGVRSAITAAGGTAAAVINGANIRVDGGANPAV